MYTICDMYDTLDINYIYIVYNICDMNIQYVIYKIYVDLYHIMIHMMSKMCISKTISGINAFFAIFHYCEEKI